MKPLRPRHIAFLMGFLLSLWFSFVGPTISVAQAATPSESDTMPPPALADEYKAAKANPDPNLVPLDAEGSRQKTGNQRSAATSIVPRVNDILRLNPVGNSPATVRFSDAFNPPAELIQPHNAFGDSAVQPEYANPIVPIVTYPGAAQTATSSEPDTMTQSTLADENEEAEDDPDPNLVPLDTEDSPPETGNQPAATTSIVPRAEDLLQLNPAGNSPATARFSDAFNPPAELTQLPNTSGDSADQTEYAIYNVPIVMDPSVQAHIRYFNTSIHDRFGQWLLRLSRYRPMVETIFTEFHLPSDLVYLSLVESGFNPYAYSRAKATGPWQFMKGTAKVYGLRVDTYVDERRDPIKSTVAAARYLRDLYDLFGTWPLAMAAYNAGEGKVMRALHKARAESFSEISKTRLIRRETKEYVPRFMAATIIARNPDRYGFAQESVEPHQFDEVIVSRPVHVRAVANTTGIPYEALRLLNPELRRDATPPGNETYHLKVPVGTKEKVEQLLDRVPTYKFPPRPAKAQFATAGSSHRYKVRIGDTLEKLSKRFRITLKTLKTKNSLSGPTIRPGDFLIITR